MKFSQHVLQETNAYHLHVESEEQLEGLPDSIRAAAKAEAENRKLEGWVFTLHFPSYVPFMKYAANRALREELYIASTTRALKSNANNKIGRASCRERVGQYVKVSVGGVTVKKKPTYHRN